MSEPPANRWADISRYFYAARQLDPVLRRHYLDDVCGGADETLRREVEALLAADERSGGFMAGPAQAHFKPGTLVGPYRLEHSLGRGGMGEVFRAVDTRLGRPVAVKFSLGGFAERFTREARTISALNHPHICTLYDVGPNYLVMELIEGVTMASRLEQGRLPTLEVVRYGAEIADALARAHAQDIVHRDLKPGNIMLGPDGVKVLDFGLARSLSDVASAAGQVFGTPAYMAPEQWNGQPADSRTDIYALGLVLSEMATGVRVVPGKQPDLEALAPQIAHVIRRCLATAPAERWQSARDVAAELRFATPPVPAPATSTRAARWRRPVVLAAAIAVALATWLVTRDSGRPPASAGLAVQGSASAAAIPTTIAPPNSIAVLPFVDLSEQHDQAYFSDGLAEELLNVLARVPNLQVTARTSSFSFRGTTDDARTIAKKLNVAHVLEGSVRKAGNRLRVTTQLVRAESATQLWSGMYDRELEDVFAVQEEIAAAVVAALELKLAPGQRVRASGGTENLDAYNQFAIGRQAYEEYAAGMQRARAAFAQAVDLDPGYAAAYAELAMSTYNIADQTGDRPGYQQALAAAERAVSLSPDVGSSYGVRAYLRFVINWDWAGATADFERATALSPGDAVLWRRYTTFLSGMGRLADAVAAGKHAADLDPLSSVALSTYSTALGAADQPAAARQLLTQAIELSPDLGFAYNLGGAYLDDGRASDALARFRSLPHGPARLAGMARAEFSLGHIDESRQALKQLIAEYGERRPFMVASVYSWIGDPDAAFRWLDRCYERRDSSLPRSLQSWPAFKPIRGDRRYAALLRKMGLPPRERKFHLTYGHAPVAQLDRAPAF